MKYSLKESLYGSSVPAGKKVLTEVQARLKTGCQAERIVAHMWQVPLNKYQTKGQSTHSTVAYDVDGGSGKQAECKSTNSSLSVGLECKTTGPGPACVKISQAYVANGGKNAAAAKAAAAAVTPQEFQDAVDEVLNDKFDGGAKFYAINTQSGEVRDVTKAALVNPRLSNYRTSGAGGVAIKFDIDLNAASVVHTQPYDQTVDT